MADEAFAAAAEQAVRSASDEPCTLRSGRSLVPRGFLRALAEAAADWPHTPPEVWYSEIMQECFWAVANRAPTPLPGEDLRSSAETLTLGVLLSMMSMDRGGHHAAADLCETALDYLASLPAWSDLQLKID